MTELKNGLVINSLVSMKHSIETELRTLRESKNSMLEKIESTEKSIEEGLAALAEINKLLGESSDETSKTTFKKTRKSQ